MVEVIDFKELLINDVYHLAWDIKLNFDRDLDAFDFIV